MVKWNLYCKHHFQLLTTPHKNVKGIFAHLPVLLGQIAQYLLWIIQRKYITWVQSGFFFFIPPLMEKCIENKNWEEFCKAKRIIIPLVLNSLGKGENGVREAQNLKKGLQKSFPCLPKTFPAGEMGSIDQPVLSEPICLPRIVNHLSVSELWTPLRCPDQPIDIIHLQAFFFFSKWNRNPMHFGEKMCLHNQMISHLVKFKLPFCKNNSKVYCSENSTITFKISLEYTLKQTLHFRILMGDLIS